MNMSEVKVGLRVRVTANSLRGRKSNSEVLLDIGEIITLTGQFFGDCVYYDRGFFPKNNIRISEIEPVDKKPDPYTGIDVWWAARKYIRN